MAIPTVLVLVSGMALITLMGVFLIFIANKPSKQSREYKEWLANDKAIRKSVSLSWKEGNWS